MKRHLFLLLLLLAAFPVTAENDVVIEAFIGFQDPFSVRWYENTYPLIVQDYLNTAKDVHIEFFHFPINALHDHAEDSAIAAICADEQGAFLEYMDVLFVHSPDLDEDELFDYAEDIGLDLEAFDDCFGSSYAEEVMQAHIAFGQARDIKGSPMFFINGVLLAGAQPYPEFQEAIDEAIDAPPPVPKIVDLGIEYIEITPGFTIEEGQELSLFAGISHSGLKEGDAFYIDYQAVGENRRVVHGKTRRAIFSDGEIVSNLPWNNFLDGHGPGKFQVYVTVDVDNDIEEVDEWNNLMGAEVVVLGDELPVVYEEEVIYYEDQPEELLEIIPEVVVEPELFVEDDSPTCDGCEHDEECFSYGTLLEVDGESAYCDISQKFTVQSVEGEVCQNDYECRTGLCVSNVCGRESWFTSFSSWFSGLFS